MTPRKILVPYDFSEPSQRALQQAAQLAAKLGGSVEVVHIHPGFQVEGPWPPHEHADRYERFLQGELASEVKEHAPGGVEITTRVLRGADVVRTVEQAAEEAGADLICIGSTGKGATARVLLGSVSQALIRTSKVPVLTVH